MKNSRFILRVIATGCLTILAVVSVSSGPVAITNVWLSPQGVVLAGGGGPGNATYHLLASSTLATPSTNWPAVATNTFDANGNFLLTNPAPAADQFFRLKVPPPPILPPDFSMIGFATRDGFATNNTLLAGGTTGGAAGPVVVVSNLTWLVNYAQRSNQPLRVLVTADIDCSSLNNNNSAPGYPTGRINVNNHKTIYSTNGATISRGTLNLSSRQNVIIRNLKFRDLFVFDPTGAYDTYGWDYVAVTGSHHVWVDHCDFDRAYDGMVDVVNGSDYVTVSWNVFRNQKKGSLVGNNEGTTGDRSKLNVTYHHNWFINVDERMPRMRFGNAHVFNQYTDNRTATNSTGRCIQATTESAVLVEHVYFTHATNAYPTVFVNGGGFGNALKVVGSVITNSPGNRGFAEINAATFTFNAPWITSTPPYPYTLDAVADVPSIVTNWAGVGKISNF